MSNAQTAVQQLVTKRNEALMHAKAWKEEADRMTSQLAEIIGPEELLSNAGKLKDGGSTTVELHGAKFNVEAEKKVKWDSGKLQTIASKMAWPVVSAIFKIKFEIAETKYKDLVTNAGAGMFDPAILSAINDARTVEVGEAKIKSAELMSDQ